MKENQGGIRLERLTKEEIKLRKQKKAEEKLKLKIEEPVAIKGGNPKKKKLTPKQKNQIMTLNIMQAIILVVVVFIEIIAINGGIPEVFSIVGLVILSVSCFVIMKHIGKIMAKEQ